MFTNDVSALIQNLSNDELKDLLNDDDKCEAIVRDAKQLKDMEVEKDLLMARNKSLSEFNLGREPQLTEGKQRLKCQAIEAEQLLERLMQKSSGMKSGDMSADSALALLQAAAAEMEEESDAVAERFLSNETTLDEFFKDFSAKRRIMHVRKIKAEKLSELANKKSIFPAVPNYANTRFGMPGNNGGVPYPASPINMPMPRSYFNNF